MVLELSNHHTDKSSISRFSESRNYRSQRNENLCKETWVSKIIAEANVDACVMQQKRNAGFYSMSVMAYLLCFGSSYTSKTKKGQLPEKIEQILKLANPLFVRWLENTHIHIT